MRTGTVDTSAKCVAGIVQAALHFKLFDAVTNSIRPV